MLLFLFILSICLGFTSIVIVVLHFYLSYCVKPSTGIYKEILITSWLLFVISLSYFISYLVGAFNG